MAHCGGLADTPRTARKYYGLAVPGDRSLLVADVAENVFDSHVEVLKALKKYPGSRFKCFDTAEEASAYAVSDIKGETKVSSEAAPNNPEKSAYSSPKTQDLCQLRVNIEKGDRDRVEGLISSNPRYLVSAGDAPAILQESFRYNALHVAAKFGQAAIARVLLDTIADPAYVGSLYPMDCGDMCNVRINRIIDMYLNTPEKGCFETPLHFASKYGHADVVMLLLQYPAVNKNAINKFGQTPYDVACTRATAARSQVTKLIQDYIRDGVFYVPLLRAEDNSLPPVIAEPWSPTSDPSRCHLLPSERGRSAGPLLDAYSSCAESWADMSVVAYAGPMSSPQGKAYKRTFLHKLKGSADQLGKRDPEKGHESVLRELAAELNTEWHEYWDFLDCHVDLRSVEGLNKFEEHLARQRAACPAQQCCGDSSASATPPRNDDTQTQSEPRQCLSNDSPSAEMTRLVEGMQRLKLSSGSPREALPSPAPAECVLSSYTLPTLVEDARVTSGVTGTAAATSKASTPAEDRSCAFGDVWAPGPPRTPTTDTHRAKQHFSPRSSLEYVMPALSNLAGWLRRLFLRSTPQASSTPAPICVSLPHEVASTVAHHGTAATTATSVAGTESCTQRVDFEPAAAASVPADGGERPENDKLLKPVFVFGVQPSKRDLDALQALGCVSVDSKKYPNVVAWKDHVLHHPAAVRESWRTPQGPPSGHSRRLSNSTPRRSTSTARQSLSLNGSLPRKLLEEFQSVE